MKASEFLLPLVLVACGIGIYHMTLGRPEAPTDAHADSWAGGENAASDSRAESRPSFETAPRPQPLAPDEARIARLEQAVTALRSELEKSRADLLAAEVSRAREVRPAPGTGIITEEGATGTTEFSTADLDHYEALVSASRQRAETRLFAKAIAGRLPKLPIDLTDEQQRRLLELTLEFRARASAVESEAEREGLRREMDRSLGDIVQGRDAQIVSGLLVEAAVPPPLPRPGSANANNR
jgi:hypothetical protein